MENHMEKNKAYERIVEYIKACGQSLIDNSEIIAGGYRFQTGDLEIQITINDEEAPNIQIIQRLIPEQIVRVIYSREKEGAHGER